MPYSRPIRLPTRHPPYHAHPPITLALSSTFEPLFSLSCNSSIFSIHTNHNYSSPRCPIIFVIKAAALLDPNPTTMVVTQAKNPAHSTLDDNSKLEEMSRMQQDLAASRHSSIDSASIDSASNRPREEMLRRVLSHGRKPHVCVVGAGFAGLRCADVLLKMGMRVTIFEARGRVGGRVSLWLGRYMRRRLMIWCSYVKKK
jgi:hypothetical protein